VAAPNLDDAYDLLERIEYNATAILSNILFDLGRYGSLIQDLHEVEVSE
jgi:hypothetical protein